MRLLLALALVVVPAAQACSLPPPPDERLDHVHWATATEVTGYWDGRWVLLDAVTGDTRWSDTKPAHFRIPSKEPSAVAPDGDLRIRPVLRPEPEDTCGGRHLTVTGLTLARADGSILHEWTAPESRPSGNFQGAYWGDDAHGFVWDADRAELTRIDWATGDLAHKTLLQALDLGGSPDEAPVVWPGNVLLLDSRDRLVAVDGERMTAKAVPTPFPGGWVTARDDGVFFGRWNDDGSMDAGLADPRLDGSLAWSAHVVKPPSASSSYSWNPRLLVVATGDGVHRFLDGDELPLIAIADSERVQLHEGSGHVAVSIRGDDARLFVLDASGDVTARFPAPAEGLPGGGWLGVALGCMAAAGFARRR